MIGKLYRLSITLGDKSYVCDNRNGDDIIIKEFHYWDQASNWIDNNFKKIAIGGNNFDYYYNTEQIRSIFYDSKS